MNPGYELWAAMAAVVCLMGYLAYRTTKTPAAQQVESRRAGAESERGRLRMELALCLHTYKLLDGTHFRITEKWRKAFAVLLDSNTLSKFKEDDAQKLLMQLTFSAEQAAALVGWRQRQPYTLVTVLLSLMTDQSDDDVWLLAAKGG